MNGVYVALFLPCRRRAAADATRPSTRPSASITCHRVLAAADSAVAIKNQAVKDLQSDLGKAIAGQKDSTGNSAKVLETTQKNAEQTLKNTFGSLFNKKKEVKDTTKTK